jgi:hypothetical protein
LAAFLSLQFRMNTTTFVFDRVHHLSEIAMYPLAQRSPHHATLLALAGSSPPRLLALPGTPIAALAGASNCCF